MFNCQVFNLILIFAWYRIWSDGWIEQGNSRLSVPATAIVITLLVSYTNTDYFVVTECVDQPDKNYGEGLSVGTKTTTNFRCHAYHSAAVNPEIGAWYACGY